MLKLNFLGVPLNNPIFISSGCFGFGMDYTDYFDPNRLGAFSIKGITLEPRSGNEGVRIAETPSGILNCVGLENPGIERFKNVTLKEIEKNITIPVCANINGSTISDYVAIAEEVENLDTIKFIELNISCPNVKNGGMAFGANPKTVKEVVKEVRKVVKKPLIVKLSPNVTDIVEIGKICEDEGADSLSLINTLLGMDINIRTRKPLLGNIFGGLSGNAVKPVALRMVYQITNAVNIPVVGMGGIACWEDALEFILAGASAISIGTHIFSNPMLPVEVEEGLENYLKKNGFSSITDVVALAHSDDGARYRKQIFN